MPRPSKTRQRVAIAVATVMAFGVAGWWLDDGRSAFEARWGQRALPLPAEAPRWSPTRSLAPAPTLAAATLNEQRDLFSFAEPENPAALEAALPAPARNIRYVRLNQSIFSAKDSPFWQSGGQGRFSLPLPDGGAVTIAIDESVMLGADRFTSTGRIEGHPLSSAVFAFNEGFLHASIDDPMLGSFSLRAATEEYSQYYQIDPAMVPGCGGERRPVIDAAVRARAMARRAQSVPSDSPGSAGPPPVAAADNPQRAEVHVMMVYTQAVLSTMTGSARASALQSAFDAAIAKVNNAFATSAITARLRLVRMFETRYAADGEPADLNRYQDQTLTALYQSDDGSMDDIHAARDQAGADMVCLALNRPDAASSGLSFLLDRPGEIANPQFSFSVVQYSNLTGTNVVPHEFGHVFGCAHDRENAMSGPGAYSYSYGYTFLASDNRRYHDIMAYPPGRELNYFSNPRISAPAPAPANSPGGIAAGLPFESDTARTIEQNGFEISTYRLQTQAAANPGTLINVSTLAFSGTGNDVLIGGFVVDGEQSKRLLVRGSGPALRAYGVTNTLLDPILRVFSGQSEIAMNNNWDQAADANEVASVAAQVGAFQFVPGSADAALLLTLRPGAYTAWLQGANGATGFGLIEAYEAERTSNKLVNLSTRGYADNLGKPMIGGFVVAGAPGATKRILIRVTGPTLARPPINLSGVMEDPQLEIRNALGELLVQNDDWSMGSQRAGLDFDDFQPLVRTYGEQHIAATGFAPGNRREPCVLLDLPPGAYTVIVRPFESLTSNPPQPARPGLAVIEAFEIN